MRYTYNYTRIHNSNNNNIIIIIINLNCGDDKNTRLSAITPRFVFIYQEACGGRMGDGTLRIATWGVLTSW